MSLASANAGDTFKLIAPNELGFELERGREPNGLQYSLYTDRKNGRTLKIVYDALGRPAAEEERSRGGSLLRTLEVQGFERREELFTPVHELTITRPAPGGFELEIQRWPASGGGQPSVEVIHLGYRATAQCTVPQPVPNFDSLLASTGDIVGFHYSGDQTGDDVKIGHNVVLQNCKQYPRNGDVAALMQDVSDAVNGGARCLASLPNRFPGPHAAEMRTLAARLLGFFQPSFTCPLKIACAKVGEATNRVGMLSSANRIPMQDGDVAQSVLPESKVEQWPIIGLNMTAKGYYADRRYPRSTLFHEMLHLLGIKHSEDQNNNPDQVYLAQMCCFPDILSGAQNAQKSGQNVACNMLSNLNPDDPVQQTQYKTLKDLLNLRKAGLEGQTPDINDIRSLEFSLDVMDPLKPRKIREPTD